MTDTYGNSNGFGWHMNEVVAAQVVSVPVAVAQQRADQIFGRVAMILIVEFVLISLLVNGIVYFVVRSSRPAD
jgi:hypothetical protein